MAITKNSEASEPGLSRRRCLALLAALPGLAWLAGCDPRDGNPLRIAAHGWLGYAPLFLARDLGHLPRTETHLLESLSAGDSMELLRGGEVHGAALTLDEVLRLRDEGLDVRVVLVFNQSLGADVLLARGDIRTLADLVGRRIGAETNTVGMLMVCALLTAAGLTREQVTLVPLTADVHEAAWRAGDVDALVTFEPVASRVFKSGGAHRLFDSRRMPDTIFDVLAMRAETLSRQEQRLKILLHGYFQAVHHLEITAVDAAHRLTGFLKIDPEAILAAYRYLDIPNAIANHRYLSPGDSSLTQAAERLSRWMVAEGLLRRPAHLESLLNFAYLPQEPGS